MRGAFIVSESSSSRRVQHAERLIVTKANSHEATYCSGGCRRYPKLLRLGNRATGDMHWYRCNKSMSNLAVFAHFLRKMSAYFC